jgi:hypothetical protein
MEDDAVPRYHVTIEADGPMWMLRVLELDRVTEVRRIGDADRYVRDLVSLMTGQPTETVEWEFVPERDRAVVTYEELLDRARRWTDRTLVTLTGRRFTVGIHLDSIVFTPASTGLGRSDGRRAGERFVEQWNATGSVRPADYATVTRNASYYLGLVLAEDDSEVSP